MNGFASVAEAFAWIESFTNFERRPVDAREYRLDRMRALLELFGNPHRAVPSVHIAGSKGKGSVATLSAAAFRSAGYRAGLYRSPHIADYRERISLAGSFFSARRYTEQAGRLRAGVEAASGSGKWEGDPTTFELLTVLAFLIFEKENCDVCVLETGLGGRLDATNVVLPFATVITSLELEHTDILGPTIECIAREKAGIIKPEVPVYAFPAAPEALAVLETTALDRRADLVFPLGRTDFASERNRIRVSRTGTRYEHRGLTLRSPVPGFMHMLNCVFVFRIIEDMHRRGILPSVNPGSGELIPAVKSALENTRIAGRMEIRRVRRDGKTVKIILDGAHTRGSAAILKENLDSLGYRSRGYVLLIGIVHGKDIESIVSILVPDAAHTVVARPGTFKPSDPGTLAAFCREHAGDGAQVELAVSADSALASAVAYAVGRGIPIVATGSFYLLGEVTRALKGNTL